MKYFLSAILFVTSSVLHAAVTVELKINSHHAEQLIYKLSLESKKGPILLVNGLQLPSSRLLTQRAELETILNFKTASSGPCSGEIFTYSKTENREKKTVSGCVENAALGELIRAFKALSPLN